jgi:hypothetical protein
MIRNPLFISGISTFAKPSITNIRNYCEVVYSPNENLNFAPPLNFTVTVSGTLVA